MGGLQASPRALQSISVRRKCRPPVQPSAARVGRALRPGRGRGGPDRAASRRRARRGRRGPCRGGAPRDRRGPPARRRSRRRPPSGPRAAGPGPPATSASALARASAARSASACAVGERRLGLAHERPAPSPSTGGPPRSASPAAGRAPPPLGRACRGGVTVGRRRRPGRRGPRSRAPARPRSAGPPAAPASRCRRPPARRASRAAAAACRATARGPPSLRMSVASASSVSMADCRARVGGATSTSLPPSRCCCARRSASPAISSAMNSGWCRQYSWFSVQAAIDGLTSALTWAAASAPCAALIRAASALRAAVNPASGAWYSLSTSPCRSRKRASATAAV